MIHPKSVSFPVYGAALAAGVDYGVALRWIDASRRLQAIWFGDRAAERVREAWDEGVAMHGEDAMCDLAERLIEAFREGRLLPLAPLVSAP
ncbi:hypothetical protein CA606_18450 [Caulobacter vibrioides]|uniref:Uncharacterized protein n=1 Tax=Caulobacter vibrioides TaxID=155892 RepID=A0A290MQ65_CAUVI|nr:hypothetical protein [Caulobacter vibrioides]ATC34152.1 hypothetical protein CA606_18450 [Caulobacter vibrioides]